MIISHLTAEQCVEQALAILITHLTSADRDAPEPDALHHIVLTGGGVGMMVTSRLKEVANALPPRLWAHVHIWWGDERFVSVNSEMRNDHDVEKLLGDFYIAENVHRAPSTENCNNVYEAAQIYANDLARFASGTLSTPQFDVVLLGLGPDGHVASLFPHSSLLTDTGICFGLENSPKPPPQRITMSLSTLNCSSITVILASGPTKDQARQRLAARFGSIQETPARGISAREILILG